MSSNVVHRKRATGTRVNKAESDEPSTKKRRETRPTNPSPIVSTGLQSHPQTLSSRFSNHQSPVSDETQIPSNVSYYRDIEGAHDRMFVDLPKPRVNLSPFFRKDIMDHLDPDMTRQDKLRCALLLMGLTNGSEERRWCNLKLGESLLNATNRVNAYALEITKAAINAKIPGIREATYLDKFDLLKDFRFSSKDKTIDNLERFDFRVQVDYKPLSVQEPPIPQNEVEEYYFQLWKHYDATNQGEEVGLVFNEKLDDPSQFNKSISKAQYETLKSEEDKKQFRKHLGSKQEKAVKAAADQPAPIASQASASTASASTTSAPQEQSNPMGVIHPTAHLIEPVSQPHLDDFFLRLFFPLSKIQ
ncbi:hypothetical protein MGN70_003598 [Eutypa lata]|nr:hypothetical protein MGN70_003598 [Eutypa lata]